MAVVLCDIDDCLQHKDRERDTWDPGDEADDVEDCEDEEDDPRSVLLSPKIKDSSADSEGDLKNTGDPDDLLGELAHEPEVAVGEYESDSQHICKQDDNHAVKPECLVVLRSIGRHDVSSQTQA